MITIYAIIISLSVEPVQARNDNIGFNIIASRRLRIEACESHARL